MAIADILNFKTDFRLDEVNKIDPTLDLEAEILKLKKEKNAVILAHYYQEGELQDLADFVGDSLDLSRKAKEAYADIIVFCGVKFMAEVAKIVNPNTKVILPDMNAGCSLENSCQADDFERFRKKHPDYMALTYINCSAKVKALSDIIVTSSNAEAIVNQLPKDQKILFSPDKHLGGYIAKKTGCDMLLWDGSCIVHEQFNEKELVKLQTRYPAAKIIAHPECPQHLLEYAEYIGSTSKLIKYTADGAPSTEYIVLTEPGIIHEMRRLSPDSQFYEVPGIEENCACNNCPYMKLNTLEKLYLCLKHEGPEITMDEQLRVKAEKPLLKMLEMSKGVNKSS